MMMRAAKKYTLQAGLILLLGVGVAVFSMSLLPTTKLGSQVEKVELTLQENEQSRSISPESVILSAAKAIIHALLPSS